MIEPEVVVRAFLDDLAQLKMDDWTEGPVDDLGKRLAGLMMVERAVKELITWVQDSVVLSMEEDELPVYGFGALRRYPAKASRWRDDNASADFRKDVWRAVEDEVSLDRVTGERDKARQEVARLVLREVDDALPAFSSLKAAGRKRLGINISEYRTEDEVWKVQLVMEGEEL